MLKKRARGYVRDSTVEEGGDSSEVQSDKIKEYCYQKGIELIKIIEDIGTGYCHGIDDLVKETQKGDYIIVTELNRISPSFSKYLDIMASIQYRKSAYLICVSQSPDGTTSIDNFLFKSLASLKQPF